MKVHSEKGLNKSYLKAHWSRYDECLPSLKIEALEKLLNQDIETCKEFGTRKEESVNRVVENYTKFMEIQ